MHRIIIRILGVSLFALLVASAPAAPGSAEATTIRENIIVPIQGVTTNPCTGEEIAYSGDSHHVFHVTVDESGGFHGTVHINFQGASGVGLVSGDEYQIAAQAGGTSNFTGVSETTNVQNVLFVSPGPDNNFRAHYLFHYTCNSNGCSVQFIRTEVSCQG
jgi:hypothetical protein